MKSQGLASLLAAAFLSPILLQPVVAASATVSTDKFAGDATAFLQKEIAAHVAAVTNLNPPQPIVLGVPTKGDFTWGSFMRAVAACSGDQANIAGRDVPQFLGKLGLIESRLNGKTFSQLGSALTLRRYGMNLQTNALWQGLSSSERDEWRALLNPARFYDFKTHHVIGLPENYMGVAARIITMDVQFGLVTNLDVANDILERASGQFLHGALYTDDNLPTGRYDRYSQEYARFIYEAAGNIGRKDIQDAVAPSIHATMRTWWAIVDPDGYSYPWGRTIGDNSYMDTIDIIGFLADHPEFRPAPLRDLTSVYYAAWNSLQKDYESDRHLLNMFGFGRGSYHYVTVERQWQQTTGFFYKAGESLEKLKLAWQREGVADFPAKPELPPVLRFDQFRAGDRPAGAWLVRNDRLQLAVPITTGVRPGISDYLPAPHGLRGFAAPVEQWMPVLTPYLELADGRVLVAGDGADQVTPLKDGQGFTAVWNRFAEINFAVGNNTNADLPFGEPEKFTDIGVTSEVTWKLDDDTIIRTEKISAMTPTVIRHLSAIFPSTADTATTRIERGHRVTTFVGQDATLEVSVDSKDFLIEESLQATGNSAAGKGTRRPIPLLLRMNADNLAIDPHKSFRWTVRIRVLPKQ